MLETPKLCCLPGTQPGVHDHHRHDGDFDHLHDNCDGNGDNHNDKDQPVIMNVIIMTMAHDLHNNCDGDDDDDDDEKYEELTWHLWRVRQVNTGCTLWKTANNNLCHEA